MGEFDVEIVTRRLTMISGLLRDLERLPATDAATMQRDPITRYAVERILTLVVDLASGLNSHLLATRLGTAPETARESFGMLGDAGVIDRELAERLAPSVGLRNLLIHQYATVDLAVVSAAIRHAQQDYGDYVRALAAHLRDDAG